MNITSANRNAGFRAFGSVRALGGLVATGGCSSWRGKERHMDWHMAGQQIEKTLSDQAAAWNRGDLDAFMAAYWKSEQLTFSSGGETQRGWQATYDRFKRR